MIAFYTNLHYNKHTTSSFSAKRSADTYIVSYRKGDIMKKPSMMAVILFLTGMLCVFSLFFFNRTASRLIVSTEKDVDSAMERVLMKRDEIKTAENSFAKAIENTEADIRRLEQKARAAQQPAERERADVPMEESSGASVFDEQTSNDVFASEAPHIVAIDPGHQSEKIDMSAPEPNGPGSSGMKAKCTTGTQGAFTGIPEYSLNLSVSLKLKAELESRGYQVVMTRTDNDTAISNKERAEYAAAQGAEICVRIHANGADSSIASGALAMSPSESNPYVSALYEDSNQLSWDILDAYCSVTGFTNWGVQYTDTMTGINWSSIPVTILEMGYMTNENDDRQMNDEAFQSVMASGIADGIDTYFSR